MSNDIGSLIDAISRVNLSTKDRSAVLDAVRPFVAAAEVRFQQYLEEHALTQQACGHPASLLLMSAETGLPLYCELCDAFARARDGEAMEAHWRARYEAVVTAEPAAWAVRDHTDGSLWTFNVKREDAARTAENCDDTVVPLYALPPQPPIPSPFDICPKCRDEYAYCECPQPPTGEQTS